MRRFVKKRRGCVAQDRQAKSCLHETSFAGRKNMEHEVRNVRVRYRVGVLFPTRLRDRDQEFQKVSSIPLTEAALSVVFFNGFFDIGDTKAMYETIFLCGSLGWLCPR